MTDEVFAEPRQNVTGRAKDVALRARDAASVALIEISSWDFFRWAVIALLAVNLLVMLLFLGSVKARLAELQARTTPSPTVDIGAEISKQMADVKSALTQSITDVQAGIRDDIAKINAKIEASTRAQAVVQPKPVQPAAKPPKPQLAPKPKRAATQP
jgi:hypothetical protein